MPGKLYSWGSDLKAALGRGFTPYIKEPSQIVTSGGWDDIQVGTSHTIGLKNGALYSWGLGTDGRTGQNTLDSINTPTQIGTATDWVSYSVGDHHTLAIKTDGTLWAWGDNASSKLGDNGSTDKTTPTQIGVDTNWSKISAGGTQSLAIKTDGTLWSWGSNANAVTGQNTTSGNTPIPTQVGTDTNWSKISAGGSVSYAIKTDGTLWAWGSNGSGATGQGTTTGITLVPTQIGTATNWASISTHVSGNFPGALAITTNNQLWGIGANANGQLGLGGTGTVSVPTQVGTATDWAYAEVGLFNSLAVKTNGELWTVGSASSTTNRTGTGNPALTGTQTTFIKIGSDTNWQIGSIFQNHAYVLKTDGSIFCWGWDRDGQLGSGNFHYRTTPGQVGSGTYEIISAGEETGTAIDPNGNLFTWGSRSDGASGDNSDLELDYIGTPTQVGTATDWDKLAAGKHTANDQGTAAIRNGQLWTWGLNANGAIAQGSNNIILVPTQVGTDSNWVEITLGYFYGLGIKSDGTLWAWGYNNFSQLGLNDTTNRLTPTQVGTNTDWAKVGAGYSHALAIKTNGTLWGWGNNANGKTGQGVTTGTTNVPTQIGTATDWKEVQANGDVGIATKIDNTLWSWGSNAGGQTGRGITSGNTLTPTQIGTATYNKFSVGSAQILAIRSNGTLWAWGYNTLYVLGDGTLNNRSSPIQIGTSDKWVDVNTSGNITLALLNADTPPANTVAPTISGTAKVGQTLTTTDGTWDGTPTPTYTYKWQVSDNGSTGWTDISGATSSTFTITSSEAGKYLRSSITATNSEGAVIATSAATVQVATGVPTEGLIRHSSKTNAAIPTEGLIFWPRLDND